MPSSITRFADPYAGTFDQRQLLDAFGFGNVSPDNIIHTETNLV